MALTDTDRRRFFLATTLTLLALPALWWASRSEDSAAPNVAVAGAGIGVDVGADHEAADPVDAAALTATADGPSPSTAVTAPSTTVAASGTAADESAVDDSLDSIAPVFLEGPSGHVGAGLSEIAVPARPAVERVTTTATFRTGVVGSDVCEIPGMLNAQSVTLVNLDNGHTVTCTTSLRSGDLGDEIVMSRQLFAQLADLTDAPIPVEIRR